MTLTYLANSSLVGQITFSSNTVTRMTTTKQYDFLNRLTSISSDPSNSFAYLYNAANQRTMTRLADSSYWHYNYDALGQVIQGDNYWVDQTIVAGQQFNYTFDTIGNRVQTQAGGDQNGANLRVAYYTNNSLNQITGRTVPGYVDIMGDGLATNGVTVNGSNAYRKNEYFRDQLSAANTSAAVWDSITITNGGTTNTGHLYVAETPELYTYDADGNLLSDGRWNYSWDAENRLLSVTSLSGAPSGSQLQLQFGYDYEGRRIQKAASTNNGSSYGGEYTNIYAYDGWNCIASLSPSLGLSNSFMWGPDLSGSLSGAGGVGGLLKVSYYGAATTNCFVACDGNGNISALANAADGSTAASYEYGPFGEVIRASGTMAKLNAFRFSTKYADDETDFLYYGYRYYNPSTGKWLSRDPIGDYGGVNLYAFVRNCPQGHVDLLGQSASPVPITYETTPSPGPDGNLTHGQWTPWQISWYTSPGADLPAGRIVQHITWNVSAYTCNCSGDGNSLDTQTIWNKFCPAYAGTEPRFDYWEAWPVKDTPGATYNDIWKMPDNNTFYIGGLTSGSIIVKAAAAYYKLINFPDDTGWGTDDKGQSSPFSGELLSTSNEVPFPGVDAVGYGVFRELQIVWNPCCHSEAPGNTQVAFGWLYAPRNPVNGQTGSTPKFSQLP